MKIVCLGDSITFGYGVPRRFCFASLAAEETGMTVINAGVNGDTTAGMLFRLERDVFAENPDALLLLGGTNDLINGAEAGSVQCNITSILQQSKHKGIRTLLGTLPPVYPEDMPEVWRRLYAFHAPQSAYDTFRRWQDAFTESFDTVHVDFGAALCAVSDADPSAYFQDGIHPNRAGHRIMADLFIEKATNMRAPLAPR